MRVYWFSRILALGMLLGVVACGAGEPESADAADAADPRTTLLARAASLEFDTEYHPPPGESLHHQTAGFAKTLCSAVFITGLDPADAAANVGGFTSPFDERAHVVDTVVDFERQLVALTLPDGVTRTAKKYMETTFTMIPEPATLSLLTLGAMFMYRRRR